MKKVFEKAACVTGGVLCDRVGVSGCDEFTTACATFGSDIDDPVGCFDHIELMFDDDHGIAVVYEAMEDGEQALDIFEVESCGGFVEDVKGVACGTAGKLFGEFDALGFTARKRGGGLAEFDVIEPDVMKCFKTAAYRGLRVEEIEGFFDAHVEDFGDMLAFVFDIERFAVEALSSAGFASDEYIGEKVHLDTDHARPFAGFASPAGDVKGETPCGVAAHLGLGKLRKELADRPKEIDVGGGVGARSATDGRLIDVDDFVDVFESFDGFDFTEAAT